MLDSIDLLMNFLSHGTTLLVCALALYLWGRFRCSKTCEIGLLLVAGFLSSGIVAQIMKHIAGRARPGVTSENFFIGPTLLNAYHSFPSGHAAVIFCFAFILSHYISRGTRWCFILLPPILVSNG